MEQIDQSDQPVADAEQPQVAILEIRTRIPGEDEQRKGNGNGDNLDKAMEQEITMEAAGVQA